MKRLLAFLLVLTFASATLAQHKAAPTFQERYVQLYKEFTKDPQNVANLIDMAVFFADMENPQANLALAQGYIQNAENLFAAYVQDKSRTNEVRKLIRKGVTINAIRQQKKEIEAKAVAYVKANLAEIRAFEAQSLVEAFPKNNEIVKLLHSKALADRYRQSCEENTIDGYYAYLKAYPASRYIDSAESALTVLAPRFFSSFATVAEIDSVAALYPASNALQHAAMVQKSRMDFAAACRANTIESYSLYLEKYPRGADYLDALARLQKLRNVDFHTLTLPEDLADYAENHGDDALADSALAKLRHMIVVERNPAAAQIYLSRFPLDEEYANVYKEYYNWFSAEGNRQPIEAFAAANPQYPYQLTVASDLELAAKNDAFDLTKTFNEADFDTMTSVVRLLTGRKVAFVALQRIMQQQIVRKDWAAAKARLRKFELSFEDVSTEEYEELSSLLSGDPGPALSLQLTADSISHAIMHPSGLLYFTRRHNGHNAIYFARKSATKNASWKLSGRVNVQGTKADAVAYNFFDNGTKVLLGIAGDIWTADVVSDTLWQLAHHLPSPVNTTYLERDAFMLADGTGLLLASDRPGGQNVQQSYSYFHGDHKPATDIYYIPFSKGRWGDAVNLGIQINTHYCELSPILSQNMRSLYFITDARGLGYGDVYRASRTDIDDWTHWSKPVNMGRNVNGAFNEGSISFAKDERQIILSSRLPKAGQCAVQSFATQHDTTSAYRQVRVDVSPVKDVLRNIDFVHVWRNHVAEHLKDRDVDTMLNYNLYKGKDYAIMAEADWFYVPTLIIDAEESGQLEMRKYSMEELKQLKSPLPLRLVRFFDGTPRLLPLAEAELRHLGRYMQQRTATRVKINVHVPGTDDQQCYDLATERAKAMRAFLVDYGVDASRIRIEAYGNVAFKKGESPFEVSVAFF